MKIHILKTWPEPFKDLWSGAKTFEIRLNDRDYAVGDLLVLRRWDPTTSDFAGGTIVAHVGYITKGDWCLPDGLCVMSISNVNRYE